MKSTQAQRIAAMLDGGNAVDDLDWIAFVCNSDVYSERFADYSRYRFDDGSILIEYDDGRIVIPKKLSVSLMVRDSEGTIWHLHGIGEGPPLAAHALEAIEASGGNPEWAHFYEGKTEGIYYVPDGSQEHKCIGLNEARAKLAEVMTDITGEPVTALL